MKLYTVLPQTLPKECDKAVRIFSSFVDSRNNGLDGVIPRHILESAKGFAIFTIFKAGFLFSARGGTGIVIAKLGDGNWSAPSAIGCAGVGVGSQLGAELTDFLIVLNSTSAVKSFMSAGSLTLGGNLSIAVGPLGRNGEAIGSVSSKGKVAAMYSYSKTRGLFGGISVEGSVIVERQDANALAYQQDVTAKSLLSGAVPPPDWATTLTRTLEACTGIPGTRKWIDDRADEPASYPFGNRTVSNSSNSPRVKGDRLPSFFGKKKNVDFPPQQWGNRKDYGSYFTTDDPDRLEPTTFEDTESPFSSSSFNHQRSYTVDNGLSGPPSGTAESRVPAHLRSSSVPLVHHATDSIDPFSEDSSPDYHSEYSQKPFDTTPTVIKAKPELSTPLSPHEGVARAIALYNFSAVEAGDLSFTKGEVITVTRKSDSTDDWWTGKVNGREGAFPANFVELA